MMLAAPRIDDATVGRRMEVLRQEMGLSKADFAALIQIDPSSYSKIAKGAKPLLPQQAVAIAHHCGATLDFLYRGTIVGMSVDLRDRLLNLATEVPPAGSA